MNFFFFSFALTWWKKYPNVAIVVKGKVASDSWFRFRFGNIQNHIRAHKQAALLLLHVPYFIPKNGDRKDLEQLSFLNVFPHIVLPRLPVVFCGPGKCGLLQACPHSQCKLPISNVFVWVTVVMCCYNSESNKMLMQQEYLVFLWWYFFFFFNLYEWSHFSYSFSKWVSYCLYTLCIFVITFVYFFHVCNKV